MKNKFKFNFSFLDKFKKSKKVESQNNQEAEENTEDLIHKSEFESNETPEDFAEKTLKGFDLNKHKDELIQKVEIPHEEVDTEEEILPDAPPEVTKRKIFNFKFPTFGKKEIATPEIFIEDEFEKEYEEFEDKKENNESIKLPEKPATTSKLNFKFPKFDRTEVTNKFKLAFSKKPSNPFSVEKFNWNDFILRIFSPYTRGKIHSVFILALVITLTYLFGKSIALLFNLSSPVVKSTRSRSAPIERLDTSAQDINKIASVNLFNANPSDSVSGKSNKIDIASIVCLDAEKQTSLQIKLLDTIVLQDSVKSVASVQVRGSSELMNVREGEKLDELAEVSKIDRMKLILKNLQTGDCEYAMSEMEPEPIMPKLKISPAKSFKSTNPNIKNVGNSFKIKRTFRDSMINNMTDVLTQAKAVQITNPDGTYSFKMTEIVPGSIYSQLDIQENDIIDSINGKKIENLNELMSLLGRIKEIDQFQIGLKRNGMSENKEYGFE